MQRSLSSARLPSILTFPSFLRKHIQIVLYMILDRPPVLSSAAWNSYLMSGGKQAPTSYLASSNATMSTTEEEEAFDPEYRYNLNITI